MPSQGKAIARDKFFEAMDEPRHTLDYGGINGEATIKGVISVDSQGKSLSRTPKLDVHMEPVPVLLRDAVTIDTAVRLTGISRLTLQRAAFDGRMPVIKTGPDNAPYLVRLRDVVIFLCSMWGAGRVRRELTEENAYLGFPEWFAREISESWPENKPYTPGKWQGGYVKINKGGRPKGYSPNDPENPGFSKNGVRLGRPPLSESEKGEEAPEDHSEAPPPEPQPVAATQGPVLEPATPVPAVDRTTLPKWHPQYVRPKTPQPGG